MKPDFHLVKVWPDHVVKTWDSELDVGDSYLYNPFLVRNKCMWAAFTLKDLVPRILGSWMKDVQWQRLMPKPSLLLFRHVSGDLNSLIIYSHDVLVIEAHDGSKYVYDATGPQFGQNKLVSNWEHYMKTHTIPASGISEVNAVEAGKQIENSSPQQIRLTKLLYLTFDDYEQIWGTFSHCPAADFTTHFRNLVAHFEKAIRESDSEDRLGIS